MIRQFCSEFKLTNTLQWSIMERAIRGVQHERAVSNPIYVLCVDDEASILQNFGGCCSRNRINSALCEQAI